MHGIACVCGVYVKQNAVLECKRTRRKGGHVYKIEATRKKCAREGLTKQKISLLPITRDVVLSTRDFIKIRWPFSMNVPSSIINR